MYCNVKFCTKCGLMKIFAKDSQTCPVCNNPIFHAEGLENKTFGHMSPEEREQYIISRSGHPLDPEWVEKRIDFDIKKHNENQKFLNQNPKIICPYCKSSNTKKITTMSKAAHTALFGIFSISRNSKQWHCNNCNSDF